MQCCSLWKALFIILWRKKHNCPWNFWVVYYWTKQSTQKAFIHTEHSFASPVRSHFSWWSIQIRTYSSTITFRISTLMNLISLIKKSCKKRFNYHNDYWFFPLGFDIPERLELNGKTRKNSYRLPTEWFFLNKNEKSWCHNFWPTLSVTNNCIYYQCFI